MFKLTAILAIAFVAVSAIPLKPDDMPRRIAQAEIDSDKDLNEFVAAWTSNDKETAAPMVDFILDIARDGYQHSVQLNAKFDKLKPILIKLSSAPIGLPMKMLAKLIDGNRDNKSYYDLETIIQWINKRQAAGVKDELLTTALAAAKESQDSLQTMADSFVNVIKAIKISTKDMGPLMNHAVKVMDEKSGPFVEKFNEAIDALSAFRAKLN